jgi:hypothetical protein
MVVKRLDPKNLWGYTSFPPRKDLLYAGNSFVYGLVDGIVLEDDFVKVDYPGPLGVDLAVCWVVDIVEGL